MATDFPIITRRRSSNEYIREDKQLLKKMVLLICFIGLWILLIIKYAKSLPALYVPHSITDLKIIIKILQDYSENHKLDVFILFCLVDLFKQTFGIPGAALLNILAGSMYGIWALPLVCLLTAMGASIAYQLSKHLVGRLIFGICIPSTSIASLKDKVDANREHLLWFLFTIRCIPIIPGWFINLASPYAGIPLNLFFISTLLGFIPYSFICIQAAKTLSTLNSVSDIFSFWVVLQLIFIALLILIPVVFKNRIMSMFKQEKYAAVPEALNMV